MTRRNASSAQSAQGRRIGYARVSTSRQTADPQLDALKAGGCDRIYQDVGSGADRARPQLELCLSSLTRGDTLVVHRLDRLARSVIHLAAIVEDLTRRGVHFTTLKEGMDTSTASGTLVIHLLGSIAEFERQLIRERTTFSLSHLKASGRKLGSPRNRDPETKARMSATRHETELARSRAEAQPWTAMVRALRPAHSWTAVCNAVNARHYPDRRRLRQQTMLRHVRRLVDAGDLPRVVLDRSGSSPPDARDLARSLASSKSRHSLREIAATLDAVGLRPARASRWSPQTVKRLIEERP